MNSEHCALIRQPARSIVLCWMYVEVFIFSSSKYKAISSKICYWILTTTYFWLKDLFFFYIILGFKFLFICIPDYYIFKGFLCLSIYLTIYLISYLSVYLTIFFLFTYLHIWLTDYLSLFLAYYLSIWIFIYELYYPT